MLDCKEFIKELANAANKRMAKQFAESFSQNKDEFRKSALDADDEYDYESLEEDIEEVTGISEFFQGKMYSGVIKQNIIIDYPINKNCKSCGARNNNGSFFCDYCGGRFQCR